MSCTKRFLENLSESLGNLGLTDDHGEPYTGQIDNMVCRIADFIQHTYAMRKDTLEVAEKVFGLGR